MEGPRFRQLGQGRHFVCAQSPGPTQFWSHNTPVCLLRVTAHWLKLTDTVDRNINSPRHPIPDVPVVYLVEPTAENVRLISSDLQRSLYQTAYVNFLSSLPRTLLEDFASQTAQNNTSDKVAQVYDQYLNFIVSEPDLFSLGLKDVYYTLNSSQTKEEAIEACADRIVSGLFSLVVTLGMNLVINF